MVLHSRLEHTFYKSGWEGLPVQAEQREELIRYVQSRWGGPNALRLAGSDSPLTMLPTGLETLDDLLGGGLPAGRISTLRAGHSSGATTITHTLVAASQRREYVVVYVDAEHSFDPASAIRSGVDLARLTLVQPNGALEGLAIATTLARCKGFDLIVFDRLDASHEPHVLATWLSCMVTLLHGANTAMLLVAGPAGRADTYHGGQALAHYSSVILAARRSAWLRDASGGVTGIRATVRSIKNKTGALPGEVELALHTGHGVFNAERAEGFRERCESA